MRVGAYREHAAAVEMSILNLRALTQLAQYDYLAIANAAGECHRLVNISHVARANRTHCIVCNDPAMMQMESFTGLCIHHIAEYERGVS